MSAFIRRDQLAEFGDDEVLAVVDERLAPARARPAAPGRARRVTDLPVRSGFCSEPESANSFSMIFWVRMNHEWSCPVGAGCAERAEGVEAREERRGQPVAEASNHSEDGPGRMRMPCCGQIGSQFWMPST